MTKKMIIAIGREFCSGGAQTAQLVAEKLQIPYYDKKIIDETSEMLQLSKEAVEKHDEKPVGFWEYSGFQYNGGWYVNDPSLLMPLGMRIANAQFDIIKKLAEKDSCVIVGRCADYALRERNDVLCVFIRAELSARILRAMRLYNVDEAEAKDLIKRTDKIRANYYKNYTGEAWGNTGHYQLVIDSTYIGTEAAADIIARYAQDMSATSAIRI